MSRLEELIKEKCPNGVVLKKIKDISKVTIGEFVHKNSQFESGKYPVYNGGITNTGYYDKYNNEGKKVIISARGANAGYVNRINEKYWAGNSCYTLTIINESYMDWNYLYYYLKKNEKILLGGQQTGSIPAISKKQVEEFKIPIPPIEAQKEIVRILDKFGELEAELEAELEERKQQYEYWREKLLNNNCTKKKINELILKPVNIKWKDETENNEYFYIDLSSVNIENKKIENTVKINKFNAPSRAQQLVLKDDILFGTTRPLLKRVTIVPACLDNNICSTGYCVLRANKEVILPKWLMYNISTKEFYKYITEFQTGASYPTVSDSVVKEFKISVPSLNEQEQIVNTLDKFDKLVNDISEGLPAEIELRKKQYEYYRNKLLSFEELKNE